MNGGSRELLREVGDTRRDTVHIGFAILAKTKRFIILEKITNKKTTGSGKKRVAGVDKQIISTNNNQTELISTCRHKKK